MLEKEILLYIIVFFSINTIFLFKKKYMQFSLIGILIIITMFFYKIRIYGFDYISYLTYYEDAVNNTFKYNYEIGFRMINKVISNFINGNNDLIFLIYYSIIFYFIYKAILYYTNSKLEIILFLTVLMINLINPINTIIRQYISISIFVYASKFIIEKKMIKYIMLIMLAFFIHNSAIILIIIYVLYNFKDYNKYFKILIIIFTSGFMYMIINSQYLTSKYLPYLKNSTLLEGNAFGLISIYFLIINTILVIHMLKAKNKYNQHEKFAIVLGCIYLFMLIALKKFGFVQRIGFYFQPFMAFSYCNICKLVNDKNLKIVLFVTNYICLFFILLRVIKYI